MWKFLVHQISKLSQTWNDYFRKFQKFRCSRQQQGRIFTLLISSSSNMFHMYSTNLRLCRNIDACSFLYHDFTHGDIPQELRMTTRAGLNQLAILNNAQALGALHILQQRTAIGRPCPYRWPSVLEHLFGASVRSLSKQNNTF